ncbi:MAG: aminotransferase class V-fold PLP-dependent enzyme [Clostridia bacterium]|nr:aminotransferase class V-fold PLP-dependent enzyme [Clostridia bacterium]
MDKELIYLDNAATSFPKPPAVVEAVTNALETAGSYHRGGGTTGQAAGEILYDLRRRGAAFFGAPGEEQVILTGNATGALNLAIKGMAGEGSRILISGYEHNAVTRPLHALRRRGVKTRVVTSPLFDRDFFLHSFRAALLEKTDLVVLTCVSNAYGWILPFGEAAEMCHRARVPLILDGSQAAGHIPVGLLPGVAFLATAGHKGLFGPAGTGLLISSGEFTLPTLLEGGTGHDSRNPEMPELPPERYEAGTPNLPGAAGLAAGIGFVESVGLRKIRKHEAELRARLLEGLWATPGVVTYASRYPERQTGVISFNVRGFEPEELTGRLTEVGVVLRGGLHCAPLAHDSAGNPTGTLRLSPSVFTKEEEINEFFHRLRMVIKT